MLDDCRREDGEGEGQSCLSDSVADCLGEAGREADLKIRSFSEGSKKVRSLRPTKIRTELLVGDTQGWSV